MISVENNKINLDEKTLSIIQLCFNDLKSHVEDHTCSKPAKHLNNIIKCHCGKNKHCEYNLYSENINFSGTRRKLNHELRWDCVSSKCKHSPTNIHFNNDSTITLAVANLKDNFMAEWNFLSNELTLSSFDNFFNTQDLHFKINDLDLNDFINDNDSFMKRLNKLLVLK